MLGLTRRHDYSQAQRWRQDCWFSLTLLIMFALSHHNLWMGTVLPGEGVLWSQQAWRLLRRLSLCWLSGWTKLMEFSSFCHLCFCPPLKDDRIPGNDKHQWGSFMTETGDRNSSSSWVKAGALTAPTQALKAASRNLCLLLHKTIFTVTVGGSIWIQEGFSSTSTSTGKLL